MLKSPWFKYETKPPEQEAMNLFCFAHAGGSAQLFKEWADYLGKDINVYPVQLPFRENRHKEKLSGSIEEILECFLQEHGQFFTRPYALFGHSLGAILAMELAYMLKQGPYEKCSCLFVSSTEFPQGKRSMEVLTEEEVRDKLSFLGGIHPDLMKSPLFMEYFLPIICGDLNLFARYSWKYGDEILSCPVHLFGARQDPSISVERMLSWSRSSTRYLGENFFDGDHFYVMQHWKELLEIIKKHLTLSQGGIDV